jgi:hypothetical protein
MADKHIVFDVLSFGLYVIVISFAGLYLFDAKLYDLFIAKLFAFKTSGNNGNVEKISEILTAFAIIGGLASFIGIMVRLISIIIFQDHHFKDEYRDYLKAKINEIIDQNKSTKLHAIQSKNKKYDPYSDGAMEECKSDPYFAFVHWQKGENQIIEWGRYKNRYAYLSENYLVGTFLGLFLLGPTSGLLAGTDSYYATSDQLFWCWLSVLVTFSGILIFGKFDNLRKKISYSSLACSTDDCVLCVAKDYLFNNCCLLLFFVIIYALPLAGLYCCAKGHNKLDVWSSVSGFFILVGALVFTIGLWTVWYYNRQVEKTMVALFVASVIANGTVDKMFNNNPSYKYKFELTL